MFGTVYPGVVHLGEIVVLGRQPKNRHGGNSIFGKPLGQAGGVQCLVDGVSRPTEQPHLLAGDHGHGTGFGQPVQRLAAGVEARHAPDQRGAPLRREIDRPGGRAIRVQIAKRMAVIGDRALGMVEHVRKQAGGVGQLGLADAGRRHGNQSA